MAYAQMVDQNVDALMEMMGDPEIQSATITVLSKMPMLAKLFTALELGGALVEPLAKDEELIDMAIDSVTKLAKPLSAENLGAAMALLEKLPMLVKLMNWLEMGLDLVEPMITDKELLPLTVNTVTSAAKPVAKCATDNFAMLKTALAKAEKDTTTFGVFGLMRLLKDPTVQKGLRIANAYLNEVSTKK